MILADKLILLRKRAGWSQEELAQQLDVSRQAVSKWEGAQSIPDIHKILQLSRLFGVATDYLLRDELEEPEGEALPAAPDEPGLRRVSMEEAAAYLDRRKADAPKLALATFLCILSPAALILLGALSELSAFPLRENAAGGLGLCILLALVAVGVGFFLSCAARVKDFDFLDSEPFETEYGVSGMVRERQAAFRETYTRLNILGTVLCILSAVPVFIALIVSGPDVLYAAAVCALLLLVGLGCIAFVYGGTRQSAMERLLEEGEFTRRQKARRSLKCAISTVFWLVVVAVYLLYTFGPSGNGQPQYSWFIWPIAGVLYAAVMALVGIIERAIRS